MTDTRLAILDAKAQLDKPNTRTGKDGTMTEQNQTPDITVDDSADDTEGHFIRSDDTHDTDDTEGLS